MTDSRWEWIWWLGFIALMSALVCSVACTDALRLAQATAVRGLAEAGQSVEAGVLERWEREGIDAVAAAPPGGEQAAADAVEARWQPALRALDVLRAALDVWLEAIEAERSGDWAGLIRAACVAVDAIEPLAPEAIGPVARVVGRMCP